MHTHTLLTNTQDVKVKALIDTLVDQLVGQTVEADMPRETKVSAITTLGRRGGSFTKSEKGTF